MKGSWRGCVMTSQEQLLHAACRGLSNCCMQHLHAQHLSMRSTQLILCVSLRVRVTVPEIKSSLHVMCGAKHGHCPLQRMA